MEPLDPILEVLSHNPVVTGFAPLASHTDLWPTAVNSPPLTFICDIIEDGRLLDVVLFW